MRDVVRTSVLSTMWRSKWISTPHLIFNDECIPVSAGSHGHDKLVSIVNHVLLLHTGSSTFKIFSWQLQTCSDIDSWILYLSLKSIKQFRLYVSESMRHNVPPCLFSYAQLIRLMLVGCIIVHPVTFKGFSCLKSLTFHKVTLSNATLKCLVSSCPQLELLALFDMDGPSHIEISNPKLKNLLICGNFIDICLKDLRNLVFAHFHSTNAAHPDQRRTCKFTESLGSLLGIQKLFMHGWLLQSLAFGDVSRRLPSTYDHLKSMSFTLNVEDVEQISVAICLLKSSPNLQDVEIWLWHNRECAIVPPVIDIQEAKDPFKCTFNKLRVATFFNLYSREIELKLVKFILANSPVLQTMNLKHGMMSIDEVLLLKESLRFKRASPAAEIMYLDPKT